jgi:hypothetical protein
MLLSDGNLAAVELHDTLKVESQRRRGKGLERTVQAVVIASEQRLIAFHIIGCARNVREIVSHLRLPVRYEMTPHLLLHISGWCIVGDVRATKRYQARCFSSRVGHQAAVVQHEAWGARRVQHRTEERAAPGNQGSLWVSKRAWLTLQRGGNHVPGMAETQDDQRFREDL